MVAIVPPDDPLALAPEVAAAAAEIHRNWTARERRRRCLWMEQRPWTVPQVSLATLHSHDNIGQNEAS